MMSSVAAIYKALNVLGIKNPSAIQSNCTGSVVIDMGNDNYTVSAKDATNSTMIIINCGNGTKTLTIDASPLIPAKLKIINSGGPVPISVSIGDDTLTCFNVLDVDYLHGIGSYDTDAVKSLTKDSSIVTTAANTNEQILKQTFLPLNTLIDRSEIVSTCFHAVKSGAVSTETFRIRVGSAGTTADTAIFTSAEMAGATIEISALVNFIQASETTIRVSTLKNKSVGFGASTVSDADITIPNSTSTGIYITLTGQNSASSETVSIKQYSQAILR